MLDDVFIVILWRLFQKYSDIFWKICRCHPAQNEDLKSAACVVSWIEPTNNES